jgi:tetratricopeptide (TPR) repeat protein
MMDAQQIHRTTFHAFMRGGLATSLQRVQDAAIDVAEPDREQAWHLLSFALSLPEIWPHAAALLLALTPKMERAGFHTTWLPYLERGLVAARQVGDQGVEAELSLALGHLRQRMGKLAAAEADVEHAVELFRSQALPPRLGAALNRLAEIVRVRHDIARAERLTDEALSLLAGDAAEQGHSYLIKSRIAFNQRHWQACRGHLEQALALCQAAGAGRRIAVCLLNLGRVCQMEQDYAGGLEYDRRAIALFDQLGDIFNRAAAQMNLGMVYSLMGESQDALEQYARAEHVFRRLQDTRHLAKLANSQAVEMHNLGRWQEAVEYFRRSSVFFLELDDWQEYVNVQDNLGLVYLARAEWDKAVEHYTALLAMVETSDRAIHPHLHAELIEHLQAAKTHLT